MDEKDVKAKRIEQEVAKTMSSLDDLPMLAADARFTSRLEHRLAQLDAEKPRWAARLFGDLRLGYALLVFIVLANLATAYIAIHIPTTAESRDQCLETLAAQYMPSITGPQTTGQ
jgi:hypothetical protein